MASVKEFIYTPPSVFELFDNFEWCQESNARDINDNPCEWQTKEAVKFDLLGAIYKVYREGPLWSDVSRKLASIFRPFWEGPLIEWNDNPTRTLQDVMNFVEKHDL